VSHRAELATALEPILGRWTVADLWAALDRADIVAGPVQTFEQVFQDPQVLHNEMVATVEHPAAGPVRVLGVPIKLHDTPGRIVSPPPRLGEHAEQILARLGYTADQIAELRARGVTAVTRQPKS
jgi:crotonobetainyl-CoA:carnitine CoA-transferase CaiB-like acyl-CoA transferase